MFFFWLHVFRPYFGETWVLTGLNWGEMQEQTDRVAETRGGNRGFHGRDMRGEKEGEKGKQKRNSK